VITVAGVADITGVVLPLVITPGASFALTVSGAVERSRWIGARIAIGTAAAITVIAAAVCYTPLAQTLSDSRLAHLLGYIGAVVLFALAARVALSAIKAGQRPDAHPPRAGSASARAFMATIVNPKALTVYLVVVPGVAASLGQSLKTIGAVFAVTHIICMSGWLAAVDALIQRASWLGSPRSRRVLQLAAAAGLVITGAILLLTARVQPRS
jgi:threonine/homoserine/homoserine lactone efflux protein